MRPRTHEFTGSCFVALGKFFGQMQLKTITAANLREYQIGRAANTLRTSKGETHPWNNAAGNSTINHELAQLGSLLNHAGLWKDRLKLYYSPLKIAAWSPRDVLSVDDEKRLFEVAKGHPEAELAYLVACITNSTSASGCELRGLRLENVTFLEPTLDENGKNLSPSFVYIPPEIVKNNNRPRKIPLVPQAEWAFQQCMKRALACGSCKPNDHLFPLRLSIGKWDPERPASRSWLRKSWDHLVRIAGTPGLRPHDLRHQFITRKIEEGWESDPLRSLCGHVNPKLTEYYSHVRDHKKLELLNGPPSVPAAPKPKPRRDRSSSKQDQMFAFITALLQRQTEAFEKLAASK